MRDTPIPVHLTMNPDPQLRDTVRDILAEMLVTDPGPVFMWPDPHVRAVMCRAWSTVLLDDTLTTGGTVAVTTQPHSDHVDGVALWRPAVCAPAVLDVDILRRHVPPEWAHRLEVALPETLLWTEALAQATRPPTPDAVHLVTAVRTPTGRLFVTHALLAELTRHADHAGIPIVTAVPTIGAMVFLLHLGFALDEPYGIPEGPAAMQMVRPPSPPDPRDSPPGQS